MTIAVAMSGGVDSSTAAALLVENNSDSKPSTGSARRASVIGLTMQLWNQRRLPRLQAPGGQRQRARPRQRPLLFT